MKNNPSKNFIGLLACAGRLLRRRNSSSGKNDTAYKNSSGSRDDLQGTSQRLVLGRGKTLTRALGFEQLDNLPSSRIGVNGRLPDLKNLGFS